MIDEVEPGCPVCNPKGHPPRSHEEIEAELLETAKSQLQIARHDHGWALIAKTVFWKETPNVTHDGPDVLCVGLQSKEAARVALNTAMYSYVGSGIPIVDTGDDPVNEFNAIGRILKVLEDADQAADLSKIDVARLAYAAGLDQSPYRRSRETDDEVPF